MKYRDDMIEDFAECPGMPSDSPDPTSLAFLEREPLSSSLGGERKYCMIMTCVREEGGPPNVLSIQI
jgi:hypothetical protein